jgi:DNA-binding transcriptional MerR regulator
MLLTPAQVCQIFEIRSTTLKNWASLAEPFLSETARPGKGKHRYYSEADLTVLAVIKSSPDYDSAYVSLANGTRGNVPPVASEFALSLDNQERTLLLQNEIRNLQAKVLELEGERDKRVGAEANVALLKEQLKEAREEIVQLRLELKERD